MRLPHETKLWNTQESITQASDEKARSGHFASVQIKYTQ